ncbi:MAG: SLBB domain-containing protein [Rubrivivax sp.]|nr:SLBB domain-containing protein [Rubrivivax sp.]
MAQCLMVVATATAFAQTGGTGTAGSSGTGPVRLQQPASPPQEGGQRGEAAERGEGGGDRATDRGDSGERRDRVDPRRGPAAGAPGYIPGEFEQFLQRMVAPLRIRRFGAELMTGDSEPAADASTPVPPDYVVSAGDELLLSVWGSVEGDLRLTVDRDGRVSIPRVGTVAVGGMKFADVREVLVRQVGQTFRNFQLTVSLGKLRGIRVFVTGFVVKPGVYTVSALSPMTSALMQAGGPSAAGSFRKVEVRQAGRTVATFDLYDLLLRGDRSADHLLRAGDVVHVAAVGPQVGVIGSVNRQGIFELKPGETVADLLQMAGGLTAVADRGRLGIERLEDRSTIRLVELTLPEHASRTLTGGDVVRAFSAVSVTLPTDRRAKRVRVEGEVVRAGEYVLPAGSTTADALRVAGGMTPQAYLFATEFTRESVRDVQRENYERALRDLESDLARSVAARRAASAEDAAEQQARTTSTNRLIERLRALQPTGRIVLQIPTDASALPDLALEDGDRIYIPPRPTTIGVFGSVFNAGSYLFNTGRTVDDYLRLAGGPTRGADERSMFVVRANGSVISQLQTASWTSRGEAGREWALPGDTIFVPEELNKTTFLQAAKDWTLLLYQLGIGLAGISSALR